MHHNKTIYTIVPLPHGVMRKDYEIAIQKHLAIKLAILDDRIDVACLMCNFPANSTFRLHYYNVGKSVNLNILSTSYDLSPSCSLAFPRSCTGACKHKFKKYHDYHKH